MASSTREIVPCLIGGADHGQNLLESWCRSSGIGPYIAAACERVDRSGMLIEKRQPVRAVRYPAIPPNRRADARNHRFRQCFDFPVRTFKRQSQAIVSDGPIIGHPVNPAGMDARRDSSIVTRRTFVLWTESRQLLTGFFRNDDGFPDLRFLRNSFSLTRYPVIRKDPIFGFQPGLNLLIPSCNVLIR